MDLANPADLERMILRLGGVQVVHADWTTYGLREIDSEQVGSVVMLHGTEDSVRVATGMLTGGLPREGDALTVGGEPAEVGHAYPERDGAWTRIVLVDPGP